MCDGCRVGLAGGGVWLGGSDAFSLMLLDQLRYAKVYEVILNPTNFYFGSFHVSMMRLRSDKISY